MPTVVREEYSARKLSGEETKVQDPRDELLHRAEASWNDKDFGTAQKLFEEGLGLDGEHIKLRLGLASLLDGLGHHGEAERVIDEGLLIKRHPDFLHLKGTIQLLRGDYPSGWENYSYCYRTLGPGRLGGTLWDGEAKGRVAVVWSDQGLGDAIQFSRYLPRLRQYVPNLILTGDYDEELVELIDLKEGFLNQKYEDQFAALAAIPRDFVVPMSQLPVVFRAFLDPITPSPYITSTLSPPETAKEFLASPEYKIGIAWTGKPETPRHTFRTIPVSEFGALLVPGVRLCSLQKGRTGDLLRSEVTPIEDFGLKMERERWRLAETAAVIARLDLVVTCDCMIAHLAGSLGVNVWLLLPASSEWRWGLTGNTTPWYPRNMRVLRQRNIGDWREVFMEVADSLKQELSGRH